MHFVPCLCGPLYRDAGDVRGPRAHASAAARSGCARALGHLGAWPRAAKLRTIAGEGQANGAVGAREEEGDGVVAGAAEGEGVAADKFRAKLAKRAMNDESVGPSAGALTGGEELYHDFRARRMPERKEKDKDTGFKR